MKLLSSFSALALAALGLFGCSAQANEDTIRKNLTAVMPKEIKIDEVRASPIAGPTGPGWFEFKGAVSSPGESKK